MRGHVVCERAVKAMAVAVVAMMGVAVEAQTITFRKIADTNTPVPGGVGTFASFTSTPVIDQGNVAFEGTAINPRGGIYTDIGGPLRPVATTSTPGPNGVGTFSSAFLPSIDNGSVAFRGKIRLSDGTPVAEGIYLETSGTIVAVAETGTPAPGGGMFNGFDSSGLAKPSLDAGNVAFEARTTSAGFGVFLSTGGVLSLIANDNTPIPGGMTTFFILGAPSLSGDNVAFSGTAAGNSPVFGGVYARIGGTLGLVADSATMAPGGTTTFYEPGSPVLDGEDIAFTDRGSDPSANDPQEGNYTYYDGVLGVGILGAPIGPSAPALENRTLVYNRGPGIISTNMGGSEFRVIGSGDVLDGKTLSLAYQSQEALSGNEIVFFALFDDGSQGIYVAQILLICGNQVVDAGEECDDGGGSAVCDADCTFAVCGDNTLNIQAGEECDDGMSNSDTMPDACRTNCLLASCGDGTVDTGEVCDDAEPSGTCDADCTPAMCGDATTNTAAGEQCDDGALNSDTLADSCRTNCTLARCGDGILDSGEECDDGNTNDGDGCSSECLEVPVIIPTTSAWGLMIFALLLCVGARLHFRRQPVTQRRGTQAV